MKLSTYQTKNKIQNLDLTKHNFW